MRRLPIPAGHAVPALRKEADSMTLKEISREYLASATLLRDRLRQLRQQIAESTDPNEIWHLKRRIGELSPILTQMYELAELTDRYYERGYHRNEKYTL